MSIKSIGILVLMLGVALLSLTLFRNRLKTQHHPTMKVLHQEAEFFILNE